MILINNVGYTDPTFLYSDRTNCTDENTPFITTMGFREFVELY